MGKVYTKHGVFNKEVFKKLEDQFDTDIIQDTAEKLREFKEDLPQIEQNLQQLYNMTNAIFVGGEISKQEANTQDNTLVDLAYSLQDQIDYYITAFKEIVEIANSIASMATDPYEDE